VKRTPEEEAEVAAESLWEPDWKKILVDSNAVLLMSGRSSLLREIKVLAGKYLIRLVSFGGKIPYSFR
jgi:hypothetical protein